MYVLCYFFCYFYFVRSTLDISYSDVTIDTLNHQTIVPSMNCTRYQDTPELFEIKDKNLTCPRLQAGKLGFEALGPCFLFGTNG